MTVLAQSRIRGLSDGFTNYISSDTGQFIDIAVVALAAVVMVLLAVQINAYLRARGKPRLLFYDLVLLHNLPRSSSRRLLNIAKVHRVSDPAFFFVCPDLVSRIKSLEMSHASTERERKRIQGFFAQFEKTVFG
jgi:hypothetical protein